jgi:uncharacterized protein with PQ loop repeat
MLSLLSSSIGYDNMFYIETLGIITSIVEAFLGTPQVYRNFKFKTVDGLSYILVFCWTVGDIAKLIYYFMKDTPIQLIFCCIAQIIIDLVIVVQIIYYTKFSKQIPYNHLENQISIDKSANITPDNIKL